MNPSYEKPSLLVWGISQECFQTEKVIKETDTYSKTQGIDVYSRSRRLGG